AAWSAWNVTPALYAEYRCTGAGAQTAGRPAWASQLADTAAAKYTLSKIFAKASASSSLILYDWMPVNATPADDMPMTTEVGRTEESGSVPVDFFLAQNFPNPFNPSTTIRFALPIRSRVTIGIFNVLGQKVETLADGEYQPGMHSVVWNAKAASGMYLYRLTALPVNGKARAFSETRKLLLLR
ncbi:MAG: T9SS type A sorting domain-containing protein, partial [Acidobacteriota bacterium]